MSSTIWTRCAGPSEIRRLALTAHRAVEAQHVNATRKLVDSLAEQALLEEILESHKPPVPAEARPLHWLLSTPFRYPPLRHGSRFGPRSERGLWYGAERLATALAEVAYYRLLFLAGSAADLGTVETPITAFSVPVDTRTGIDLLAPPFRAYAGAIADPVSYAASQPLGSAMRAAGVAAFRAPSARDAGGVCAGVFEPSAFAASLPAVTGGWRCFANRAGVEYLRDDPIVRESLSFPAGRFLVAGALPQPAAGTAAIQGV